MITHGARCLLRTFAGDKHFKIAELDAFCAQNENASIVSPSSSRNAALSKSSNAAMPSLPTRAVLSSATQAKSPSATPSLSSSTAAASLPKSAGRIRDAQLSDNAEPTIS